MGKIFDRVRRALNRFFSGARTIQAESSIEARKNSVAAGHDSVAVGRNVYGNIYHMYQSAPEQGRLSEPEFRRILDEYLRWVLGAYGTARLYGLESPPAEKGPAVRRDLSQVFVPLSLRRFAPLRRQEIEATAREEGEDPSRVYLRLAEEKRQEGEAIPFDTLLTVNDHLAIIGGAGSGKSTLLQYLAFILAKAARDARPPYNSRKEKSALFLS